MAFTQAANLVEKAVGHGDNATVMTDISNYNNEYGMESGDLILATTWEGKNQVKVGKLDRIPLLMSSCHLLTTILSGNAQAEGGGCRRRDCEGDGQHDLRERPSFVSW